MSHRLYIYIYMSERSTCVLPGTFKNNLESVTDIAINWFQNNLLSMNYEKTHFLQFFTKQHNKFNVQIVVPDSIIPNVNSTKFLGLTIDSTFSWKGHILYLSTKLNTACYAIRTLKSFMSLKALKTVYFSCFPSIMSYGVIKSTTDRHFGNMKM